MHVDGVINNKAFKLKGEGVCDAPDESMKRRLCVRLANFPWTGTLLLQPSATVQSCSSNIRKRSSISTNNACQKVTPWTVPSTTDTTATFRPDTPSPWKTGRS